MISFFLIFLMFEHLGKLIDIEECIPNLRMAAGLTDDRHPNKPISLSNLGRSQLARFERLGELTDLEYSISNLHRAVQMTSDGHPDKAGCLSDLGISQAARFIRLGELTDIEDSIANLQTAVHITEYSHPDEAKCLANLGISQQARFNRLGQLTDIEKSISNLDRAVHLTEDGHLDKARILSHLGRSQLARFDRLGGLTDLEHSISNLHSAIQSTDHKHPDKAAFLSILGTSQRSRFERLCQLTDLEHSLSNIIEAAQFTDDGHPDKAAIILNLGISHRARFQHLSEPADLIASISSFKAAAQSKTAYPRHALLAARYWADLSYDNNDISSALDGYRTALEMLPKVAWLGLSATSRQDSLSQDESEHLGCLAATCAIRQGRFDEAVELLDLGRSVFWQQASSLRVELAELKEIDPELADELERVGQKLDVSNFSGWLLHTEEQNAEVDSTEDIGKQRRRLVGEWEVLLERVRRLPYFENFLKPAPFRQLCQAAAGGHVIIINVSGYGVDTLIFDDIHQIEHVPLPHTDMEQLSELAGELLSRRPTNASEARRRKYTSRYLMPTLRHAWNDIVVPIFNKIQVPLNGSSVAPERRV
jgi:tetratricopeptide (TPR) repeat protein